MLRPFFSYFGGKWRAAPKYPAPSHKTIIEPFAGSAGYATRYPERDVLLVEKNHKIASIWRYLISADEDRILNLPDIGADGVDAHCDLEDSEKWLIGLWISKGTSAPRKTPSAWVRSGTHPNSSWGPAIRERIASQVQYIRHWIIIEGDYTEAPDEPATWFIDPPYRVRGTGYPESSKIINFDNLGEWCRTRSGQVIV